MKVRAVRYRRKLRRIAFPILVAAAALAQTGDLESILNQQYDKKVVTLVAPAAGSTLSYDIAGQLSNGKEGVGGLDDRILIDKVKVRGRQLEIEGQRAAVMFDPSNKSERLAYAAKVKLVTDLASQTSVESADAALKKIFATSQQLQARRCDPAEAAHFAGFVATPKQITRAAAEIACMPDGGRGYLMGGGVGHPKGIFTPDPEFTQAMRREKRTEAHVGFAIRVDERGVVTDVIPIISPDMAVAFDAGNILRTWKFEPARLNGSPVASVVKVEISMRAY